MMHGSNEAWMRRYNVRLFAQEVMKSVYDVSRVTFQLSKRPDLYAHDGLLLQRE